MLAIIVFAALYLLDDNREKVAAFAKEKMDAISEHMSGELLLALLGGAVGAALYGTYVRSQTSRQPLSFQDEICTSRRMYQTQGIQNVVRSRYRQEPPPTNYGQPFFPV